MTRKFIFYSILLFFFCINLKAQVCSGPKVFVSVTGSNPYTLTAHLGTGQTPYIWYAGYGCKIQLKEPPIFGAN